jgi:hypothetical protein
VSGKIYGGTGSIGHLFVYDPATGASTDLGQAVSGIDNVRSLTVAGGKVYGGTGEYGVDGHLFSYNPASGAKTDLGVAVAGEYYIYALTTGSDGKIYGGTGSNGHLFTYNPANGAFSDKGTGAPGWAILSLTAASDGTIYGGVSGGHLFAYHPGSGLYDDLAYPVPAEYYIYSLTMGSDGKVYGGTGYENGHLFVYDPGSGTVTDKGRAAWGGTYVYTLARAADGKIYGGGQQGLFLYDPANHPYLSPGTATSTEIIPAVHDLGNLPNTYSVYAMVKGKNGKIYFGSDDDGHLRVYDPTGGTFADLGKPVAVDYYIHSLSVGADGKIYGGTYGWEETSGHLFVYNPATGALNDLGRPVVTDYYVWSLAVGADGKVYGGTYGYEQTSGHLFVYNPATGTISDKGQAVAGETGVFALTQGTDGKIYGATGWNGHLFAYSPSTGQLTDLGSGAPGEWEIYALVAASSGTLYGTGYDGYLFSYRPSSGIYTDLGEPVPYGYYNYALAMDGTILYGASHVYGTGRTTAVLFAYDTGSGSTRVIGAPQNRSTRIYSLTPGGGLLYGGTSDDSYLFAYEPGFHFGWGTVSYGTTIPGNTALTVDVLSQQGSLLLDNVTSGSSLASIDPTAYPALKLHAELSTGTGGSTPRLLEWSAGWTTTSVWPRSLHFMLAPGEPNTASRPVQITTQSKDPLTWTASDNRSWLSVQPTSGAVPATLTVTVNKAGLAPGAWYSGTVTVQWSGEFESGSADVAVSLYVGEHWNLLVPLVARAR